MKLFELNRLLFFVLSKDFLKMTLIAMGIATPLVIIFSGQWLSTFAYRISVGPLPYFFGGLLIFFTVLLTISYETVKAANLNPVDKLRAG